MRSIFFFLFALIAFSACAPDHIVPEPEKPKHSSANCLSTTDNTLTMDWTNPGKPDPNIITVWNNPDGSHTLWCSLSNKNLYDFDVQVEYVQEGFTETLAWQNQYRPFATYTGIVKEQAGVGWYKQLPAGWDYTNGRYRVGFRWRTSNLACYGWGPWSYAEAYIN